MIRGVVFDCFGVLYGGSLETLVAMAPPENRQAVHDVNLAKDYGYVTYEEYTARVGELTGATPEQVDEIICQYHVANQPMLEYAQKLRQTHKTALLSNIGDQTMERLFDGKVDEKFSAVVLSYREGIAKPNPEVFALVAERLGLSTGECVMIDDIAANCEGAEVAGMRSIQHTSNERTFELLKQLLTEQ